MGSRGRAARTKVSRSRCSRSACGIQRSSSGDTADVGHALAMMADAQPLPLGQLDDLNSPAVRGVIAISHRLILPPVTTGVQPASCCGRRQRMQSPRTQSLRIVAPSPRLARANAALPSAAGCGNGSLLPPPHRVRVDGRQPPSGGKTVEMCHEAGLVHFASIERCGSPLRFARVDDRDVGHQVAVGIGDAELRSAIDTDQALKS